MAIGELPDSKSRAACDLDGVLTLGAGHGPYDFAPIRPGATAFLKALHERYEEVVIHTARPADAAKNWLRQNGLLKYAALVTNQKLPCKIYLDDRAVAFKGDFAQTLKDIRDFEPFWKADEPNVGRESYDSASTQVEIPAAIAEKLRAMAANVPEDLLAPGKGREDHPHITVLYGITEDESTALPKLRKALKGFGRVRARFGPIGKFEVESKGFDVVKVGVISEDLRRLRKLVETVCEYETDFPDYEPHATIAYVKLGDGEKFTDDRTLSGVSMEFDSLTFCTKGDHLISISLV